MSDLPAPEFKLERDGDQVGADHAPVTRQRPKPIDKDKVIEKLRAENAALTERLDGEIAEIRQSLGQKQNIPEPSNESHKSPDILDQDRPFSKTRNSGGGIFYEQDGKRFDGKFRVTDVR